MGNRRLAVVVIVTALIIGLCATMICVGNRKAEPANPESSVYVEPMDPNAGPQAMHPDNPEFGGGPNYKSDTRLTPDPGLDNHRPMVAFVRLLIAINIALLVSTIAMTAFSALKDRKTTYTSEESDSADENVDAEEADASR